jgi:hypothetical protein
MGRSILHRKVMQNRRRERDPEADHLMSATHYNSEAHDAFVEQRDHPFVPEPVVQVKASEMAALLARLDALEGKVSEPQKLAQPSANTPDAETH